MTCCLTMCMQNFIENNRISLRRIMSNEDNNCQARLPLKDVPIELQQKVIDLGGKPDLNLYKVLANNPTLLSSWIEIFRGAQLCNSQY
ncbi:unnamed protein product [Rotaria socialis]|uniref:Uncharacterized protein n=1 Tax=Rotaria socialis TaxID=392032 RepID=A0A821UPV0_9BILA|nr:unnamed protein product [Rotaria socialis]